MKNPECKINQKPQAPAQAPATGQQACPWSGLPRRGDVRRRAGLLQMAGMGARPCATPAPRERPVGSSQAQPKHKQGRQSPCVSLASSRCLTVTVSLPHLASREEAQQEHSRARASEIVGTLLPHHRHRFLPRVSDADSASSILEVDCLHPRQDSESRGVFGASGAGRALPANLHQGASHVFPCLGVASTGLHSAIPCAAGLGVADPRFPHPRALDVIDAAAHWLLCSRQGTATKTSAS